MGEPAATRVLVTGAAGLLGGAVAAAAGGSGWDVVGLVHERRAASGVATVRVDVRSAEAVADAVRAVRPGAVVHTAYRRGGEGMAEVNAVGAANVARAAHAAGARLVHVSSDVVFDGRLGRPLREDDPVCPLHEYGAAKAAAETLVGGIDHGAVLVRTSLIYAGDGSSDHEAAALAAARGLTEATFFDDELRCPVAVADLAAALVELAAMPGVAGPLHVAGADAVSRWELARLVAAHGGLDPAVLRGGPGPANRPKDLRLDCSLAARLLRTRLRGVREVLG